MPVTSDVPLEELEGRKLDLAVREEVVERPGYSVDPEGVEADVSMTMPLPSPSGGLRSAWSDEAEEYEDHQKVISAPRYCSESEPATELEIHMLSEHPSGQVRRRYLEFRYDGEMPACIRGMGEPAEVLDINPEAIARAAVRAVRDA